MGGIRVVEELAQPLPQGKGGHAGTLGAGVDAAVDGGAYLRQVAGHLRRDSGGLGKGGGSVVQVDGVHINTSYRKS